MRRRFFFLCAVFRFSQAFIVPDLSQIGIRPTPKNPAGARILNSREKEGYWRHHCLKHCFVTKFASSELSSTATKNQCASGCTLLRTLRNYDGDGYGDVKKAIGLISKITTLHMHHANLVPGWHHALFVNFFAVSAPLRLEMAKFQVYLRTETAWRKILPSLSELGRGPLSSAPA